MDSDRFDTLTRSLHGVRSRRGALAALLAGTVGVGALANTAAKKHKKGKRKKKEKPYSRANGARCKKRKECSSALCGGSGTCLACVVDADCGSAGCFCAQPSGGGSMVCVSIDYTSGAISNCAICKSGEVCRDAEPGTFDCFPRCGG